MEQQEQMTEEEQAFFDQMFEPQGEGLTEEEVQAFLDEIFKFQMEKRRAQMIDDGLQALLELDDDSDWWELSNLIIGERIKRKNFFEKNLQRNNIITPIK